MHLLIAAADRSHRSSGSIREEETMDKRRAQRRQRVANKVGDLSTAAVGRAEAARVVGGDGKKSTAPPKTTTYMTYTLSDTMISS
jgi:hypothetical protein